jgi:Domain of unknown function (DUF4214)
MKRFGTILIIGLALLTLNAAWDVQPARAVAMPNAINWNAPPAAFVTSLYWGVLGRAPESTAVVNGWASQVTNQPGTRLNVFWGFMNSPEYRNSAAAREPRPFNLYRRTQQNTRRYDYYYAKQPAGGNFIGGKYSANTARAVRRWYTTFIPSW